jgi:hypothetical protein
MAKVFRFRPPNPLADKVKLMPEVSAEELCAKAGDAIEQVKTPLFQKLEEDVDRLRSTLNVMKSASGDGVTYLNALHAIAFEMKGLAGMFGYPLVARVSELILQTTGSQMPATGRILEVIGLQVDAITLIIRERRAGDGGEMGHALIASLQMAMDRVSDAPAS